MTVIQCFGSAWTVNGHLHSLVLDGVFTRRAPTAAPVSHLSPAPTDEEIALILEQVHHRVDPAQRAGLRVVDVRRAFERAAAGGMFVG